ncbi:hypothetical protein N7522_005013 [Penicillium canescens]|uniref:uncharacterized protein n=1 Tax=Penicillium canescens TaxID=5083 RepID=UPI0026E0FB07|nr:uncharacterized protein N7446_004898 [Penicillium canescens]KAJ6009997.1 hypothetical protein N7522_005013 [Penicillium canescens]KAJ6039786.1 hypothetical protein N7444_008691 [Penicillium canescens]KAJ6067861.1 hypothetical protein N7446_004898 [Penicillium canescens]
MSLGNDGLCRLEQICIPFILQSNVVVDGNGTAISCKGMTYEWRAPELRDEEALFDLPFQVRQLNDTWAYGKLSLDLVLGIRDSVLDSYLWVL